MEELKMRIRMEGEVFGTETLKVDAFLNHQIDPGFIMRMGKEFAARFQGSGVTKILTIEASGIAVAMAVGLAMDVPVVFAKKKRAVTQDAGIYQADVFSFTRKETSHVIVTAKYLTAEDTILIVDDFLAHGEALRGLTAIVRQAGAKLAGAGIVIEKKFQHGGEILRREGVRIESLAVIERMDEQEIVFAE